MPMSGHRDIDKVLAGKVHRLAYPSAKKSAAMHGYSQTTEYQNRQSGHPVLKYLRNAKPWVLEVHMAVLKEQNAVDGWPEPYLFERYRLLPSEIQQALADKMRLEAMGAAKAELAISNETLMQKLAEQTAVLVRLAREQIPDSILRGTR